MLRVAVPIDVSAVARTASIAFALATPLRVGDLVTAAIAEALGPRAPQDKRERVVRSTLAGLLSGTYVVEVDGRIYTDPDDVAVCSGTATLRFFLRRALRVA
jgi:O-acetyl-ADP-ribose deacetylase (regulator of RNase III)